MATQIDEKTLQATNLAIEAIGHALGLALPAILSAPPTSEKGIHKTCIGLDNVYRYTAQLCKENNSPMLEPLFINALIDGLQHAAKTLSFPDSTLN